MIVELQQPGQGIGLIVRLRKPPFWLFYFRISKYHMGGYFLKTCFLKIYFKKSCQGTVFNLDGFS